MRMKRISFENPEAFAELIKNPQGDKSDDRLHSVAVRALREIVKEELSERQKEVLTLIMNNNRISVRSLAKELNINNSAAQSHIDLLKENGFLTRIGGTRGYWEVTIK